MAMGLLPRNKSSASCFPTSAFTILTLLLPSFSLQSVADDHWLEQERDRITRLSGYIMVDTKDGFRGVQGGIAPPKFTNYTIKFNIIKKLYRLVSQFFKDNFKIIDVSPPNF